MRKILLFVPTLLLTFYSCNIVGPKGDNNVVFDLESKIYTVDTDGANLRLLANGSNFVYSQTKGIIIYIDNKTVHSMNYDGTNNHVILTAENYISDLKFNSSGTKICISYDNNDKCVMNTDGSGFAFVNFRYGSGNIFSWSISPLGDKIVLISEEGLFLIDQDGNNIKCLRETSGKTYFRLVSFPSDENKILYDEFNYMNNHVNLRLYNLADSTDTILSRDAPLYYEVTGSDTIILSGQGGTTLLDLKTVNNEFLPQMYDAHLSKDGKKIACRGQDYSTIFLYDMKSGLKNSIFINLPGDRDITMPILTSDNKHIIFQINSVFEYYK